MKETERISGLVNPMECERMKYEQPLCSVFEMEIESCVLTGSGPNNVRDYEDGQDYSYIPTSNRNTIMNA